MRHLLDIDDLNAAEFAAILQLGQAQNPPRVLQGRGVGLVFEKASNRTRNSSELATFELGGHPISVSDAEIGIDTRESAEDIIRVLAQYHAVVGARVKSHKVLERMAAADVVPVVNLLSDVAHPCQAVADLITLEQCWGSLAGHSMAWVGDGNNVARSLALACAHAGVVFRLAAPAGHWLGDRDVDAVRSLGGTITQTSDPAQAVRGADAVSTDVWVSMGQEAESKERMDIFTPYQVDRGLMNGAAEGAVFLHCLPAHRGEEVTGEVIDGPASVVFQQAGNRLAAFRGVLLWLMGAKP